MTKASKSPVTREVDAGQFGPVAATVTGAGLQLRRKGTRTSYGPISWTQLFIIAAKMHADAERADKQKNRPVRVKRGLMSVGGR